jgi:hypothetical protein
LNGPIAQPNTKSIPRWNRSGASPCGFSSKAASAGDSVNEFTAEITVLIAMVNANCS